MGTVSPLNFNVYIQDSLNKVKDGRGAGIKSQGETINMILLAYDVTIVVENEIDLKAMIMARMEEIVTN